MCRIVIVTCKDGLLTVHPLAAKKRRLLAELKRLLHRDTPFNRACAICITACSSFLLQPKCYFLFLFGFAFWTTGVFNTFSINNVVYATEVFK